MVQLLSRSRSSNLSLIIFDLTENGLRAEKQKLGLHDSYPHGILPHLPLALPASKPSPSRMKKGARDVRAITAEAERILAAHVPSETILVFGLHSDPLQPFENDFETALKLCQLFAHYYPKKLFLQSRSPLVTLLFPILKSLADRVVVTVALETDDQSSVQCYTPQLPAVSERVEAARALHTLGIPVFLQVAPILPARSAGCDAVSFARTLTELSDAIYVRPLHWFLRRLPGPSAYRDLALGLSQRGIADPYGSDAATELVSELQQTAHKQLIHRPSGSYSIVRTQPIAA